MTCRSFCSATNTDSSSVACCNNTCLPQQTKLLQRCALRCSTAQRGFRHLLLGLLDELLALLLEQLGVIRRLLLLSSAHGALTATANGAQHGGQGARTGTQRTIRPYDALQPESKRAFERAFEELGHRAGIKTGGITAFDKRGFGIDLRFTHRSTEFVDSQCNEQLEVLDAFLDYTVQMALSQMPSTGEYRKPSSARPTCITIPGMWMPETVAAGEARPRAMYSTRRRRDLGIPKYPPLVLDVLPFYELIIKSPAALQQYGHLPRVAVSFLGRHASNAASEGCHSVAKLHVG